MLKPSARAHAHAHARSYWCCAFDSLTLALALAFALVMPYTMHYSNLSNHSNSNLLSRLRRPIMFIICSCWAAPRRIYLKHEE
jgi:hypothetical protein